MLKRILSLGLVISLITAGIAIDDIFRIFVRQFPDAAVYDFLLAPASISLFVLAAFFFFFSLIVELLELFRWWRLRKYLRNTRYDMCHADDIPKLHAIAALIFDDILPLAETQALYNHNPRGFRKVTDISRQEIVGYFCLLPLTNRGRDTIKRGELTIENLDHRFFNRTYFPSRRPVYLGSIVGINRIAKFACLYYLQEMLKERKVLEIYTRPTTKDGLRLVRRHMFKPVGPYDDIKLNMFMMKRLGEYRFLTSI